MNINHNGKDINLQVKGWKGFVTLAALILVIGCVLYSILHFAGLY